MTEQLDFGTALARRQDPDTSHQAAAAVRGETATRLEGIVLDALKARGSIGATTHELFELTGLALWSLSPRIRPLVKKNLVTDTGTRRPGPTGRACIVWKSL